MQPGLRALSRGSVNWMRLWQADAHVLQARRVWAANCQGMAGAGRVLSGGDAVFVGELPGGSDGLGMSMAAPRPSRWDAFISWSCRGRGPDSGGEECHGKCASQDAQPRLTSGPPVVFCDWNTPGLWEPDIAGSASEG